MSDPAVRHLCPNCGNEVSKEKIFLQLSYLCLKCMAWGPWKDRKVESIKNNRPPKGCR